ncbi:T9SS type A sorting domain-containing protein [Moheibacter lacus]|nr:T9SS type A sorting domain-containing protein [Moheibacter lacus]
MKQFLQPFKTLITLLFFGIMFTGNAQFEEQAKLVGDFRESRAEFGTSVDFNDDFIAVGASRESIAAGAVYIYKTQGENIEFHQKLTAFDAAEGAEFGGIVRFMDDYLVVASGRANVEEAWMAGALYIYKLDANDEWTFHAKLVASDYQDTALLGANPTCLDTNGNILAVGAMAYDNWTGAVYIFENNDGVWTETQKVEVPDGVQNENFGIGVSISDDYLIVGASGANNGQGKAYVFKKNANNAWELEQVVMASDAQNNIYFGTSVSVDGNQFVVGAYAEGAMSSDVPAAYVFEQNVSGQWDEVQRIASHESGEDTYFGWHCEMKDDMLFVAAPHVFGLEESRVNVYKKNENGSWDEFFTVTPSDNFNAFFGWHFAYHGDKLLVGAPRNDFDENGEDEMMDAGAAFMFKQTNLGFEEMNANQNSISVYPNPVENQLNIVSKEEIKSVEIYSLSGQKISSKKQNSVNVSHLPKGTYIIKTTTISGKVNTQKFIKI